eukprot:Skav217041  [mRNA]  locus=scaffold3292:43397:52361:+ [translate_table: standard]
MLQLIVWHTLVSCSDFLALGLGRQEWPVHLHLYDLSRGLASMLGPMLLSKDLEGVWHTGIVVYGKEYYFGGDIFYDTPANTGFGTPRVVIPMGTTLRQRDELHAFIVDEPMTRPGTTAITSQIERVYTWHLGTRCGVESDKTGRS